MKQVYLVYMLCFIIWYAIVKKKIMLSMYLTLLCNHTCQVKKVFCFNSALLFCFFILLLHENLSLFSCWLSILAATPTLNSPVLNCHAPYSTTPPSPSAPPYLHGLQSNHRSRAYIPTDIWEVHAEVRVHHHSNAALYPEFSTNQF